MRKPLSATKHRREAEDLPADPAAGRGKPCGAIALPTSLIFGSPSLDTYRTMCLAPEPAFRQILEDIRELRFAA